MVVFILKGIILIQFMFLVDLILFLSVPYFDAFNLSFDSLCVWLFYIPWLFWNNLFLNTNDGVLIISIDHISMLQLNVHFGCSVRSASLHMITYSS